MFNTRFSSYRWIVLVFLTFSLFISFYYFRIFFSFFIFYSSLLPHCFISFLFFVFFNIYIKFLYINLALMATKNICGSQNCITQTTAIFSFKLCFTFFFFVFFYVFVCLLLRILVVNQLVLFISICKKCSLFIFWFYWFVVVAL